MLLGLNLTVNDDDIVAVTDRLYTKTPEALQRLLGELRKVGYEVEDLREAEYRKSDGVTVEQMEKNGWSMWFAKLPDIRHGKCGSCDAIIDVRGIQSHGHTCEECGEVTYYDIIDGSTISFEFISERYRGVMFSPQLSMKAKRWDTEEGYLYLYPKFLESGGLFVAIGEKAEAYLNEHRELWEIVEEDGEQLLKLRYPLQWSYTESAINPSEIYGHYHNHRIVKIWDGTEYREWDHLPIPETISIYEAWHWAPVEKSPTIHAKIMSACGQVSDKGYYYQDGRVAIYEGVRDNMANYIRHFTNLDADAFLQKWSGFRKSGPGFIDDFARFCHESPEVEDRPNMFNTINTAFNMMAGKPISRRESEAAIKGEQDPLADDFMDMLAEASPKARKINRMRKAKNN